MGNTAGDNNDNESCAVPGPHSYGSDPRVFDHYVRKRRDISLDEAVRQIPSASVRRLCHDNLKRPVLRIRPRLHDVTRGPDCGDTRGACIACSV